MGIISTLTNLAVFVILLINNMLIMYKYANHVTVVVKLVMVLFKQIV